MSGGLNVVDSGRLLIGRLLFAAVKRQQRNNIALRANGDEYEYLKDEVARRLVDRLEVSAWLVLLLLLLLLGSADGNG